ncbi:acyltransferase [Aliarcobacter cryaerophilus]|uniref:acyltransferase n=1 Tax=Aliarcobacter cryaerophilus TaxID=28198 RepID=UPI003DA6313A
MLFKKIIEWVLKKISNKKYAKFIGVKFGDNCRFYTNYFGSEPYLIKIGNDVTLTDGVKFINHDGGVWVIRNKFEEYKNIDIVKPITIGNNVFIGSNTIILPGVNIGDDVIIAAGSIVTKNLDSGFVYKGIPAVKYISINEYIEKNCKYFENTKGLSIIEKKNFYIGKKN